MKKYVAVWAAVFFIVICLSLYLMLETLNTSPGRFQDLNNDQLSNFEQKINGIQEDIRKNEEIIDEIREAVKKLSKDDKESIERLQKILDTQKDKLKRNIEKLEETRQVGSVVNHVQENVVLKVEQPGKDVTIQYNAKSWRDGYVSLRKEVSVPKDMCNWVEAPIKHSDVEMEKVFQSLPFDNPDGGAWKQGWNVTYPQNHWHAEYTLQVFVVPHSHTDPGWVKTLQSYYDQQTRQMFENMLIKLEQYPDMTFIYAEIAFLHLWWNEINEDKRRRVKKLIDERRLEIVTGGWVMTDEANAHYFAMLDQLLEGHQWLDGTLGVKPSAGWAIDPFGHSPTMAYLLRRSGFNNMLLQRVHYAVKKHLAKNKQLEFMWRQTWDHETNTDILCHIMPFYSYDIPHTCGPEPAICCQFDFRRLPGSSYSCPWQTPPQAINDANVAERVQLITDQWKKKATLYSSNSLFIPLGDDFRYDSAEEWDTQYTNYNKIFEYLKSHPDIGVQAQFGTLSDYFTSIYEEFKVKAGEKPTGFPTLNGDFYTYADKDDHYWSGYFTSRPFQKNLDRVMESNLRAAEILFTLALATARRQNHAQFPATVFMDKLIMARRNLGLFQHHDAIAGTAKDFVVVDYGNRLITSLRDTKLIIKECAVYLSLDVKAEYTFSQDMPIYNVDETRTNHDSLPEKSIIDLGPDLDIPRPVLFYNSLAQSRDQVVSIYVNYPHVKVKDHSDQVVVTQVQPFWENDNKISDTKFKVSFRITIPALGIVRYTVQKVAENQNPKNVLVSVLVFNSHSNGQISSPVFSIQKVPGSDITLENPYLKASFSGTNGLLTSVITKGDGVNHNTKVEFVTYGTKPHNGDRSGAYLFLPDGPGQLLSQAPPTVHITQGPVTSEVHVYFTLVEHIVTLYNSSGIDGISLDMYNIVDITSQNNIEIAVRVTTGINNKGTEFYTDLNGFQMQKHKTYQKLSMQGNVYPMPTMAFIEDEKHRFSVLSANSLGFSNLMPGVIEVMLDRRLNQDDSRGLGQGVIDNKRTPSRFKLLLETRNKGTYDVTRMTAFPSLLGHQTSIQFIHPVFVLPAHPKHTTSFPRQSNFSPMHSEMPCDVHLLNLRTMQNKDDGPNRLVPKNTAALFLHRLGVDCSFPNKGLMCDNASGQVTLSKLFNEVQTITAQQLSLTLMYEDEVIESSAALELEPMEIASYVVTLQ